MHKNGNRHSRISRLLIPLLIIAVIAGGFIYWQRRTADNQISTKTPEQQTDKIDLAPATAEDQARADQHKEDLLKETPQPSGDKKSVTPVIVDAGQYDQQIEVRSFVPGIIETDGACQVTFTSGSAKIIKEVGGIADASTTRCENVRIARSEFAAGSWSVTVSYSSANASGSSEPKTFEVK